MIIASMADVATTLATDLHQLQVHGPLATEGIIDWGNKKITDVRSLWDNAITFACAVGAAWVAIRKGFTFPKAITGALVGGFVGWVATGGTGTVSNQMKEEIESAPAVVIVVEQVDDEYPL